MGYRDSERSQGTAKLVKSNIYELFLNYKKYYSPSMSSLFERLLSYFQSHADKLGTVVEGTKIFDNKSDAGILREDELAKFLKIHIPKRCNIVKGGFVFDYQGVESNQIDLIITNDATLQFLDAPTEKSFNAIEGCNSVISVKTFLDKDMLIDSIDNLASVPPPSNIQISSEVSNPEIMITQIPQKIIFAYGGLNPQTIYGHLSDHLKAKNIPLEKAPNMIIVNNSYYIELTGASGIPLVDGTIMEPNTYGLWIKENNRYLGALALVHLLVRVQHISTLSPYLVIGWEPYLKGMALASLKKTS